MRLWMTSLVFEHFFLKGFGSSPTSGGFAAVESAAQGDSTWGEICIESTSKHVGAHRVVCDSKQSALLMFSQNHHNIIYHFHLSYPRFLIAFPLPPSLPPSRINPASLPAPCAVSPTHPTARTHARTQVLAPLQSLRPLMHLHPCSGWVGVQHRRKKTRFLERQRRKTLASRMKGTSSQ